MISIALAAYNGEKYIREQLDSILAQDYNNWELVICDDNSTDSTVGIINEYLERNNRVRLIRNEQNLVFVKNFEKAIKLCRGEYIALSDQDDIWTSDHLSKLLQELKTNDSIQLVCADAMLVDINNIDQKINYSDSAGLKLFPLNKTKLLY